VNCRNPGCGVKIKAIRHADTDKLTWVHVDLGEPYRYCRTAVATPPETVGEWLDRLFKRNVTDDK
jgi:hypothetical protein